MTGEDSAAPSDELNAFEVAKHVVLGVVLFGILMYQAAIAGAVLPPEQIAMLELPSKVVAVSVTVYVLLPAVRDLWAIRQQRSSEPQDGGDPA